jgi:uncharacterized protein (TIGR01244 family)
MNNPPCETHELQAENSNKMAEYPVSDRVVLAGQPQPEDWPELVRRGFGTVINVRSDPERAVHQAHQAQAAGLVYLHLPLPVYELEQEHLATFNQVLNKTNHGKVLLHCRTASRTALLWLLNRVVYEGWSQEQAEAELRAAGYDDEAMSTFRYCTEDFFERAASPALA